MLENSKITKPNTKLQLLATAEEKLEQVIGIMHCTATINLKSEQINYVRILRTSG